MWLGVDPRKADQLVRGTLVLAARSGQIEDGRWSSRRATSRGSRRSGRRRRRRRRPGQQDQRRLARFRRGDRDARHDASGRRPRKGARPARSDAESEDRHGHADVTTAIKETKAGKVEYRVDKTGVIHVPVGKVSFDADKIVENTRTH